MFKNLAAPEEFPCPICYGVLKDPLRDPHGHVFGETCLQNSLRTNGNCPLTRTNIRGQLVPAADIRERMAREEVYCCTRQDGCAWEGRLGALDDHLKTECQFFPLPCRFVPCQEFLVRSLMPAHLDQCPHRPVPCGYCGKDFHVKNMKSHVDNECPEFLVQCPAQCQQLFPRKLQDFHKKYICSLRQKQCRFAPLGCQFKGLPEEVSSHMQLAAFLHLGLAETRAAQNQVMTAELTRQIYRLETLAKGLGDAEGSTTKKEMVEALELLKALPTRKFEANLVEFYVPRQHPTGAITFSPREAKALDAHGDVVLLEQEFNNNSQLVFTVFRGPQEAEPGLTLVGFTQKIEVVVRPDHRLADPTDKRFVSVAVGTKNVEGLPFLRADSGDPIMLDYLPGDRRVVLTNLQSNEEVEVPAEIDVRSWQPFLALWGSQTVRLESLAERSEYLP